MTPAAYRKKPIVIQAWQLTADNIDEVSDWVMEGIVASGDRETEGVMRDDVGDWIIRGVQGQHYSCKPDIFAATYEAVTPS